MKGVYSSFLNAGFSHEGALALSGEVGRENGFNSKYIFGDHSDPANAARNVGFFSWQKDRATNLLNELGSQGLLDESGRIKQTQESLNAMAQFARKEMDLPQYGSGSISSYLSGKDVDFNEAHRMLGRQYIRWRYDDPKYASHHRYRDEWRDRVSNLVGQGIVPDASTPVTTSAPSSDYNVDRGEQERILNKSYTRAGSVNEPFFGVWSSAYETMYLETNAGIENFKNQKLEEIYNHIQKVTGVSLPERNDSPIDVLSSIAETGEGVSARELITSPTVNWQEKIETLINTAREQNPDVKLPFKSYDDVLSEVGRQLSDYKENLSEAAALQSAQNNSVNNILQGLGGSLTGWLSDPVNALTTVATAPLGLASLPANMALQASINVGQEIVSDVRARAAEEELGIERSLGDTAANIGVAAAAGAVMPAAVRGLSNLFSAVKSSASKLGKTPEQVIQDAAQESFGVGPQGVPFEGDLIGSAKLDKILNDAAEQLSRGDPIHVVSDSIPGVKTQQYVNTIKELEAFLPKLATTPQEQRIISDLQAEFKSALNQTTAVPRNVFTKAVDDQMPEQLAETAARIRAQNRAPIETAARKFRAEKEITDLPVEKRVKSFEEDILSRLDNIELKAQQALRESTASTSKQKVEADRILREVQELNKSLGEVVSDSSRPSTFRQSIKDIDSAIERHTGQIKKQESSLSRTQKDLTFLEKKYSRKADEGLEDIKARTSKEELKKLRQAEKVQKKNIAENKNKIKELNNRKRALQQETKEIEKAAKERLAKLNKRLSKLDSEAKKLEVTKLKESLETELNKRIEKLEASLPKASDETITITDIDGNEVKMTVAQIKNQIQAEKDALEAVTACAASIGV